MARALHSFVCVAALTTFLARLGTFGALGGKYSLCEDPSTHYIQAGDYFTSYVCLKCPPTQASEPFGLYGTPCICGRYFMNFFRRTYAGYYNGSSAFFDTASLTQSRLSTNVDFLYPRTSHNFSMRLSGFIRAPKTAATGIWNFSLTSTSLSSLRINGTEVASVPATGGAMVALVYLRKKVVQYFEVLFGTSGKGGSVIVSYAAPGDRYHTTTWNPLLTCGSPSDCPPGSILTAETVCHPCRARTTPNINQTLCVTRGGKARCPGPNYFIDLSIGGFCVECDTLINNYNTKAQTCTPCGSRIGFPACINGPPCPVANSYVGDVDGMDTCLYCDPNYFNLDAASNDPTARCVPCGGLSQPACQNAITHFVRRVYVGSFDDDLSFFDTAEEWAPPSLVTTVLAPTDVTGFTSAGSSTRLHGFFQVPVQGNWQFDFSSSGPLYILVNGTVAVNFTTQESFTANGAEMNVTVSLEQNVIYYLEIYFIGVHMRFNAPNGLCYSPGGTLYGCNPALTSGPQFDWRNLLTSGRGSNCPAGSILEPTSSVPDIVCATCPAGTSPNSAKSACV